MIPKKTLQEIQDRLDIVEVIGGYIPLKKAGRNFKALCPFHPEKTPSFMVYPQKQFFICYGCGAGGDLISFVIRFEHLEFPEAVRMLAQRAGVPVPRVSGSLKEQAPPDLYRAHELAADFYHELLIKAPEAEQARAYLLRRGLQVPTWETFRLGYAPNRWEGLVSLAREKGLAPEILEKAGLAIAREEGQGWYDRFRHRAIFPIADPKGRVIGFGGRVLEEEGNPKYMNSPETELYVKGKVLFGLNLAAGPIREKDFCIVVEGYMDLITPFQHGIRNIVASMGTSLTPEQVRLIRRYTRHVVIIYDGDYAGEMATLRGLDLFLEAEMRIKVVALPSGLDPDSLIQTQGIQALVRAIQESQDLFDYKLGLLQRRFDSKEPLGRVRICEEILPTIQRVPSPIQRGEYIKRLAEGLGVAEELLWAELKRVRLDSPWRASLLKEAPVKGTQTAEELLAGLLLDDPSRVVQLEQRIEVQDLKDPDVQQLATWLLQQKRAGALPGSYQELMNHFPRGSGQWEGRFSRWLAEVDPMDQKEVAWEEVLQKVQENLHRSNLENLRARIRQAEQAGDEATTFQLILEYNRLMKAHLVRHAG